jgi:hypothetical protein
MTNTIDADTYLQASVALLSKKGKVGYRGSFTRATAAYPVHVMAGAEALSEHSGETRSKVLAVLTEIGLRSVLDRMDADDLKDVQALTVQRTRALMQSAEDGEV